MKSLATAAAAAGILVQTGIAQADETNFQALISSGYYLNTEVIGVSDLESCRTLAQAHSTAVQGAPVVVTCLENGAPQETHICQRGRCNQTFPRPD